MPCLCQWLQRMLKVLWSWISVSWILPSRVLMTKMFFGTDDVGVGPLHFNQRRSREWDGDPRSISRGLGVHLLWTVTESTCVKIWRRTPIIWLILLFSFFKRCLTESSSLCMYVCHSTFFSLTSPLSLYIYLFLFLYLCRSLHYRNQKLNWIYSLFWFKKIIELKYYKDGLFSNLAFRLINWYDIVVFCR